MCLYNYIPNECTYLHVSSNPANTRRWGNVGFMLGQRRRRWANIKPTLAQRLVFAGNTIIWRIRTFEHKGEFFYGP